MQLVRIFERLFGASIGKSPTFAESAKMGHPLQQQLRTRIAFAARARQGRYINDRQGRYIDDRYGREIDDRYGRRK
jgi:hypothetical protein